MTAYEKIDKWLKEHETKPYQTKSLDSIADYIEWAWKFRKITEEEKNEVVDRIIELFERGRDK